MYAMPRFRIAFGKKERLAPCNRVLRAIFRACHRRFVGCATQERECSRIGLEPQLGRQRPLTWGRKDEEYMADFCLVSRRNLEDFEYRLFRYHFLLGADWKLCCRRLGLERAISSMRSIGSSKNSAASSGNWSHMLCFPWMSIFMALRVSRQLRRWRRALPRYRNTCGSRQWRKSPNPASFRRTSASIPRLPRHRCPQSLRRDD